MTEQELEERITEQMDRETVKNAILMFEIENLKRTVEQVENISGFLGVQRKRERAGLHHSGD